MKTLSILIVDDNSAARKLLRSVLTSLNIRLVIYEAASGKEAILLNKTDFYNIIFLDIEMPEMQGFEVLKAILAEIPNQFVVIVSANATVVNVKKTIELGGQGFIAKPYTAEKVKGVINKFLQIK